MAQSAGLHEPAESLSPEVIDRHRANASLQEELEAIDWYDQRVSATSDASLAAVLAHNRDEEKEHAAMTLEWLRRHDPVLDQHLRTYRFTELPITEVEAEAEGGADMGEASADGMSRPTDGSLGIGSLKGRS
jgi:ferritin-like protein